MGFVINLYEKYSLKAKVGTASVVEYKRAENSLQAVLHHRMVLLHKKESTEKALEKSTKNRDDVINNIESIVNSSDY